MNGIEVKHITKNYGTVCALNDISLRFEEKKIYGLLGRNGAGKSTLLNIITNRIFADKGEVLINDIPASENDTALKNIYLMSEKNLFPESMKIHEVFRWSNEFYPNFDLEYANALAEKFELKTSKTVKSLSTGYSTIFKLIAALSSNAPYTLLDEPVLGLDANHRVLLYQTLIEKFSNNPSTFVISTHLIEEVSNVLEDIIIINKGEILKNETVEELLSKGYTISGKISSVDHYIIGKNVIGTDILGGLKTAYILGNLDRSTVPSDLEVSKLDLQKLFVQLTNQ